MRHPVTKIFLARLRALAAAERAAYPVTHLPGFMTPFARHTIRLEEKEGGDLVILEAGEATALLFGRALVGGRWTDLFREGDRARAARMMSACLRDRIACVFSADAAHSRFRRTAIEAMLAPEPWPVGSPRRASICVAAFGFPRHRGAAPLPELSLTGERYADMDGFVGHGATLRHFRGAAR